MGAGRSTPVDANNNPRCRRSRTWSSTWTGRSSTPEEQYYKLQVDTLRKFGKEFTIEMKRKLLGVTTDKGGGAADRDERAAGDPRPEYESQYEHYLSQCPPLPGANELIMHLHATGVPMAICTNSTRLQFDIKTSRQYGKVAADDPAPGGRGQRSRRQSPRSPHPDPYFVTMERFEKKPKSPKNVLVFEDSITGARSAIDAGCTVILIPQPHFNTPEMHEQIDKTAPPPSRRPQLDGRLRARAVRAAAFQK
ncbi:HAD-superfamily hydrolase [Aphelenchoides fujianensis]|nr:HAD-superfamily hydrolase [Aphelenchoides fujianensis]